MVTFKAKAAAHVMAIVLLACSAITESFCPSVPTRVALAAGGPSFLRGKPSDADTSVYGKARVAAGQHTETFCELGHHNSNMSRESSFDVHGPSPSRETTKTMSFPCIAGPSSSAFEPGAPLCSSLELKFQASSDDTSPPEPGPGGLLAHVPAPKRRACRSCDERPWTNVYYCYYSDYYDDSEAEYQEEGGNDDLGSSGLIVPSTLEGGDKSLRDRVEESRAFRRVQLRASWKECKDKSLRHSAAPILDLVGLAVPLLFLVGFSLTG